MCDKASLAVKRSSGIGAIRLFRKSQPSSLIRCACNVATGKSETPLMYVFKDLMGKGCSPVKARKAISPNDQMSTATVYSSLAPRSSSSKMPCCASISGAKKPKAPLKVRRAVRPSSARLLIPKSPIFTHQSGPLDCTRMFCNFQLYSDNGGCIRSYGCVEKKQTHIRFQIPMGKPIIMHK
jgi:hypothetical protein